MTWRIDTLGWQSIARDVAIINENDIWVVGEFHKKDNLGEIVLSDIYNGAHWNGETWELIKIPTKTFGSNDPYSYEISTIENVGNGELMGFSITGAFVHYKNGIWTSEFVPERKGSIYAIYDSSPSSIWFAGTNGNLTYFNGTSFSQIETGTNAYFTDISGEEGLIYLTSALYNHPASNNGLFRYQNGLFEFLIPQVGETSNLNQLVHSFSVWLSPDDTLWVAGSNAIFKPLHFKKPLIDFGSQGKTPLSIQGVHDYDVWVSGSYGLVAHFNGNNWKIYSELEVNKNGPSEFYKIRVSEKTVVTVGYYTENRALVVVGKRE